jgi:serine/threonine protein kinase
VSKDEVQEMVSNPDLPIPVNYGPWLKFSSEGKDLLLRLLTRNRRDRISAKQALQHPWFEQQPWWPVRNIGNVPQSNIVPMIHSSHDHVRFL